MMTGMTVRQNQKEESKRLFDNVIFALMNNDGGQQNATLDLSRRTAS